MGKKKENDIVLEGVNKVFEDTPMVRANKCVDNMSKQLTLSINRLELISKNLGEFELYHMMDDIISVLREKTDRIICICNSKVNYSEEVVTNDKCNKPATENQFNSEGSQE